MGTSQSNSGGRVQRPGAWGTSVASPQFPSGAAGPSLFSSDENIACYQQPQKVWIIKAAILKNAESAREKRKTYRSYRIEIAETQTRGLQKKRTPHATTACRQGLDRAVNREARNANERTECYRGRNVSLRATSATAAIHDVLRQSFAMPVGQQNLPLRTPDIDLQTQADARGLFDVVRRIQGRRTDADMPRPTTAAMPALR